MRYWSVLSLLALALPSYAENSLYDALKSLPQSYVRSSFDLFPDGTITVAGTTLSKEVYQYRMDALLTRQYVPLDPASGDDYVVENVNVNEALPGRYKKVIEDTVYVQIAMIATVAALAMMPESISKWDMDALNEQSLGERWKENVTTRPVWDKDEWAINYIGHPVSGAAYYAMARNDGMSIFESAAYSTILSTFFWEYGYESFAEKPSIQDQIFTPLIGSFLGEGMHVLEGKLDKNGGKVWGSKGFGSFCYFLLDPMGSMAGGLSDIFDMSVTMRFNNYTHYADASQFRYDNDQGQPVRFQDRDYGFLLTFQ